MKVGAAPELNVRVEDIRNSRTGSDPDPETSYPDTSVETDSEVNPTPAVGGEEQGDVDDGVSATPGGTGDPDSIDVRPVDPAAAE